MALRNEEMMVVVMAVASVVMSYASTWSPTALNVIEPLLRATQHRATEVPFSIVATVLTQLQSLQARRAWKTSAVEEQASPANSAERNSGEAPSNSSSLEQQSDSSSEDDELESSADHTDELTEDGSEVTSHIELPTESRKRKRLTSAAFDGEDRILHKNIMKLIDMYKDNSDTQRALHQERMAFHRETLATIRDVSLANTTALNRVADAIEQLAAGIAARQRNGSD